jgi:hypothetical protein
MGPKFTIALGLSVTLAAGAFGQVPPPTTTTPPGVAQVQSPQLFTVPAPLYRQDDIGRALSLSADQINRLNQVTAQTEAQFRDRYNAINTMRDAERLTRYRDLTREYLTDWNRNAQGVFNDAQRARYQQLYYQYGGFDALYDPAVQRQLSLTPAQIQALNDQANWSYQQQQLITEAARADATRAAQQYRDYWQQRQQRFNTYLTPQQQRAWTELTGEPYQFQPYFRR